MQDHLFAQVFGQACPLCLPHCYGSRQSDHHEQPVRTVRNRDEHLVHGADFARRIEHERDVFPLLALDELGDTFHVSLACRTTFVGQESRQQQSYYQHLKFHRVYSLVQDCTCTKATIVQICTFGKCHLWTGSGRLLLNLNRRRNLFGEPSFGGAC